MNKCTVLLQTGLAVVAMIAFADTASAQTSAADQPITVAIPAQDLSTALRKLAEASGLQLVYDTRITDGRDSPGVSGTTTVRAALAALLAGSGLSFQFTDSRSVVIADGRAPAGATDGVRAVGVVSVEGANSRMPFGYMASPINGVNGSADVEATEGTGSYTTGAISMGSKIPLKIRETPQSVSVITAQRIADEGLTSLRDVIDALPGVISLNGGNTEEFAFQSRGFDITTLTFDGGAPTSFNYNNRPLINLSEYDSLQILRGADGVFTGYGDPGGVLNLVRKKPLDQKQITAALDVGSWRNFREEIDITGPLTTDRSLRGRLVASRQDRHYFYDIAESHKSSVYGVLDYDIDAKTLLTVGGNYIRENNTPNQGGLPRYLDGGIIDFPRSTCFCVPFNEDKATRYEAFVNLNHQINANWATRLNATYNQQTVDGLYYNITAFITRTPLLADATLGGFGSHNPLKQFSIDYNLSGKFNALGHEHSIVVGANFQDINNDGGKNYSYPNYQVDIFNFNPYAYPKPAQPEPFYTGLVNRVRVWGVYANLRLEPLKNLHVTVGLRYNSYKDNATSLYDFDPNPQVAPPLYDRSWSKPSFGVTYDFLNNFTLYGSHQKIYKPQFDTRYAAVNFTPPPITGVNDELGIKWEAPSKRLNASLAFYNIVQNGYLQQDFTNPGSLIPAILNNKSRGFDAEINGEIYPGLQISASYAYNDNKVVSDSPTFAKSSYTPHHAVKTWLTYRGRQGAPLAGVILGAGFSYRSKAYSTGYICAVRQTNPNDPCPRFQRFDFFTKGFITVGAKAGYKLNEHLDLSVNLDNLFDVKTYTANPFQNVAGYNFFIEPRSVLVSLRGKW